MNKIALNAIRIGSWLIFASSWLLLCNYVYVGWNSLSADLHYDIVGLLALLGALWGCLASERGREPELFMLSVTASIALEIVHKIK